MFKGKAVLELNEQTIIEALQEYFDKRISPEARKTTVKSVAGNSNNGYNSEKKFTVELQEADASVV